LISSSRLAALPASRSCPLGARRHECLHARASRPRSSRRGSAIPSDGYRRLFLHDPTSRSRRITHADEPLGTPVRAFDLHDPAWPRAGASEWPRRKVSRTARAPGIRTTRSSYDGVLVRGGVVVNAVPATASSSRSERRVEDSVLSELLSHRARGRSFRLRRWWGVAVKSRAGEIGSPLAGLRLRGFAVEVLTLRSRPVRASSTSVRCRRLACSSAPKTSGRGATRECFAFVHARHRRALPGEARRRQD